MHKDVQKRKTFGNQFCGLVRINISAIFSVFCPIGYESRLECSDEGCDETCGPCYPGSYKNTSGNDAQCVMCPEGVNGIVGPTYAPGFGSTSVDNCTRGINTCKKSGKNKKFISVWEQ